MHCHCLLMVASRPRQRHLPKMGIIHLRVDTRGIDAAMPEYIGDLVQWGAVVEQPCRQRSAQYMGACKRQIGTLECTPYCTANGCRTYCATNGRTVMDKYGPALRSWPAIAQIGHDCFGRRGGQRHDGLVPVLG